MIATAPYTVYLPGIQRAKPSLRLGAAVQACHLVETYYYNLLTANYRSITPENEGKYWFVSAYGWGPLDKIIATGKPVHYHCLRWCCDQQPTDPEAWIREAIGRYNVITAFDVVNEGYLYDGTPTLPDIEDSYRIAHECNPITDMYYNGMMFGVGEQEAVKRLVLSGLVDGVGIEMHHRPGCDLSAYLPFIGWLKSNHVPWRISEYEYLIPDYTPEWLELQAWAYRSTVQMALDYGASEFCTWGFTDAVSWQAYAHPMPFDVDYKPKPAWYSTQATLIGD